LVLASLREAHREWLERDTTAVCAEPGRWLCHETPGGMLRKKAAS
jgi:hypothetical protein